METKPGTFLLHKLLAMMDQLTKSYMTKIITELIGLIENQDSKKKWKKFMKNHN